MKKAILIIHGFVGSTYDNEYLANYLELDDRFKVFTNTLPGHYLFANYQIGKYEEWVIFTKKSIQELIDYGYKDIYVIGHGLGGVLATILANNYPEIKKIILLNTSFKYLNFNQTKINILTNKDYKDYVVVFNQVFHTSIPFFIEFVKLIKTYQDILKEINNEVLIIQSDKDKIVSLENAKEIYDNINSKNKTLTYITNGEHIILSGNSLELERKKEISEYIRLFLRGGKKWKKNKKEKI